MRGQRIRRSGANRAVPRLPAISDEAPPRAARPPTISKTGKAYRRIPADAADFSATVTMLGVGFGVGVGDEELLAPGLFEPPGPVEPLGLDPGLGVWCFFGGFGLPA